MTLMRFDPSKELDRLAEQAASVGARGPHSRPMDALRPGGEFIVHRDVPGVGPDDIDLTVERNVVSIRVHQPPARHWFELVVDDEVADQAARLLAERI